MASFEGGLYPIDGEGALAKEWARLLVGEPWQREVLIGTLRWFGAKLTGLQPGQLRAWLHRALAGGRIRRTARKYVCASDHRVTNPAATTSQVIIFGGWPAQAAELRARASRCAQSRNAPTAQCTLPESLILPGEAVARTPPGSQENTGARLKGRSSSSAQGGGMQRCTTCERHEQELAALFVGVLRLCREAGLLKVGTVVLDGTKMEATESLAANRSYNPIAAEVEKMLREAEAVDQEGDETCGPDKRGTSCPRD